MLPANIDPAGLIASTRVFLSIAEGFLMRRERHSDPKLRNRSRRDRGAFEWPARGELPRWPEHLDHFAIERDARRLRREYVADLIRRLRKAITARLSRTGIRDGIRYPTPESGLARPVEVAGGTSE